MQNRRKSHWENAYEKSADNELSWFQAQAEPSLTLIRRHVSSTRAKIFDIGAGTSRLVDELVENGYSKITLVDISRVALDRTANRLGADGKRVRFVQTDIMNWEPGIVADLWHDRAVFHFLTEKSEQDAYLEVMDAATIAGSIIIIGAFASDGPKRCSGLPVRRYSAQELASRFGDRFELLESLRHVHRTPADREQPFTFAVFRRS